MPHFEKGHTNMSRPASPHLVALGDDGSNRLSGVCAGLPPQISALADEPPDGGRRGWLAGQLTTLHHVRLHTF
jgi:hypothetical protein